MGGTITPSQVLAQLDQGFTGDFDELVCAIRAGTTYTNVRSFIEPDKRHPAFSPGAIRGQLPGNDDD
jgi:hypothetical protein